MNAVVRSLADAALTVVIAPVCASCAAPLEEPSRGAVCGACWAAVPFLTEPLCELCGDALASWRAEAPRRCMRCTRQPRLIAMGRAIGPYEGALRDILHALKYGRRRSVARPLGSLMSERGATVLSGADFVVPVPLHFVRHYRRGFNQAADLAAHVGVPALSALRRRRRTRTQTDLPEGFRHRNVRGAFAVRGRARAAVAGAILVLIDDVSTTGATMDACAGALLEAGAKEVRALTAARAASQLR